MFYDLLKGVEEMITFELKNPEKVKLEIALNGHSIRSFSNEIGISNSFLSQILNAERKASAKTAKKISDGFNKDVKEIFFITNA